MAEDFRYLIADPDGGAISVTDADGTEGEFGVDDTGKRTKLQLSPTSQNEAASVTSLQGFDGDGKPTIILPEDLLGALLTLLAALVPAKGDIIYAPAPEEFDLLPGSADGRKILVSTGNGTVNTGTEFDTLEDGDIPAALTGKSINGIALTESTTSFNLAGGTSTERTLIVDADASVSDLRKKSADIDMEFGTKIRWKNSAGNVIAEQYVSEAVNPNGEVVFIGA